MYVSLTQPEFPTLKATLNIKPVEPETMKITHYKKFPLGKFMWYATLIWVAVLLIAKTYAEISA